MTTDTSTATETMSAVVSRAGGSVEHAGSLVDATIPAPAAPTGHDLLVEVKAVSVNPVDVKIRAADSGGEQRILGWDAAGTVLAVGEKVTLFQPGDDVYYAGSIGRAGSYSQRQLVDERIVGPKPATLSYADAAALPLTGITAWETLFEKLGLTEDSSGTLLILGAAGGVGSILIQLAKELTGLRVIATASRPQSREWVASLGADVIVDHAADDLDRQILDAAPEGVDYVFTPQSKGRIPLFTKVVRPFGEIVAIDDERDLDLIELKGKALSWHWELMFTRPLHGYDLQAQHRLLSSIAALVDEGRLQSTVTRTLTPVDAIQLREAHRIIETGHAVGKIVVADAR
jgi:NADPH:quinone reductase